MLQPLGELGLSSHLSGGVETSPYADPEPIAVFTDLLRLPPLEISRIPAMPKSAVPGELLTPLLFPFLARPRAQLGSGWAGLRSLNREGSHRSEVD